MLFWKKKNKKEVFGKNKNIVASLKEEIIPVAKEKKGINVSVMRNKLINKKELMNWLSVSIKMLLADPHVNLEPLH